MASQSLLTPLYFQQAPPVRALNPISLHSTQGWAYAPERTPRFLNDQSREAPLCHRGPFPCLVCGPSLEFHAIRMVSFFLTTQEGAPCLAYHGRSETACIRYLNLFLSTHPCSSVLQPRGKEAENRPESGWFYFFGGWGWGGE